MIATSTLVRRLNHEYHGPRMLTRSQAIAIHTFVMVWCNKGFNSIKAAWIAISIPWVYSFVYVAVLRIVYHDESNVVFRPSPVRSIVSDVEYLLTCSPVLVLDWQAVLTLPTPGRISLDVDVPVHLLPLVYPLVLLGPRKRHDWGKSLALRISQPSED
jgi:hypothetical protein